MFILRSQWRDPHFFQKCCHFCWIQNKVSENDNTFERNEDCTSVFLKKTDFSWFQIYLLTSQSFCFESDPEFGIQGIVVLSMEVFSGIFHSYPYSYWQYHLTIFAVLIPTWCKYPILVSKTNRGDIRLYFKTYEIWLCSSGQCRI